MNIQREEGERKKKYDEGREKQKKGGKKTGEGQVRREREECNRGR